jgi:uncharacterized protein YdaU (DUF1376 family)
MSSGPVFVAWYSSDWIAGTRGLSQAEKATFIDVLSLIYENGGPVPNNRKRLARICGTSASSFQRSLDSLIDAGKLFMDGDLISNDRAVKELGRTAERNAMQAAKANARWTKTDEKARPTMQSWERNKSRQPSENPNDNNETLMPGECRGNATQTQTQTHKEERVVRAPAASAPSGPRLEDYVSPEQASDFRKHRVALKAKLTPGAEKGICRELVKVITAGFDPGEALETGMAMGWKAIKADWIINHAAKDHGHGNRSTGARSSANEASAAADDHWAEFDRRAGRGHDDGGYYGTPDSAPNVRDDDRFSSEGFLEGVLVRPEAFRR